MEQVPEGIIRPAKNVRTIFVLIIAASFLDIIDFSIVQVAHPTIRTQFLASLADSQWIVGAYGITLAGFLMLSGRAGDVYGQKLRINASSFTPVDATLIPTGQIQSVAGTPLDFTRSTANRIPCGC